MQSTAKQLRAFFGLCIASDGLIIECSLIISILLEDLASPQSKIIHNCCSAIRHLGRPANAQHHAGPRLGMMVP